ncbi:MAG: hypothetical protein M3Y87_23215 [Myxococcota bacterium]|nr:hypothetical protein [Myxococcota bacterium]
MRGARLALVFATLAIAPLSARAHVTMTSPTPRYGPSEQKDPPCGRLGGTRTDRVAVYEPGATITVEWDETVDHAGHYRIAFDAEGDDDLAEPAGADWITPDGVMVLADDIADSRGGHYTSTITLPDVECESCTLQLIQVMYGRGDPYYYQCADLALRCATPGCAASGSDAGVEADAGMAAEDAGAPGAADAGARIDAGTTAARDGGARPGADAGGRDSIEGGCSVVARGRGRAGALSIAGALVMLALCATRGRRWR